MSIHNKIRPVLGIPFLMKNICRCKLRRQAVARYSGLTYLLYVIRYCDMLQKQQHVYSSAGICTDHLMCVYILDEAWVCCVERAITSTWFIAVTVSESIMLHLQLLTRNYALFYQVSGSLLSERRDLRPFRGANLFRNLSVQEQ
jgi:hypothetical protein